MQDQATLQNKAMKAAPKTVTEPSDTSPVAYLKAKGWTEFSAEAAPSRVKRWRDPLCHVPGGWFCDLAEALEVQRLRDDFPPIA